MKRWNIGVGRTAAGLAAIVGLAASASATLSIAPTDVITWGGAAAGRATPGTSSWTFTNSTGVTGSGTSTLAWTATVADDPQIDAQGRVYFRARVAATAAIGNLTAPRGIFTATNSTDISAYMVDGNVVPSGTGYRIGSGDLATPGIGSTNTLHVSGSQVGVGIQIGDPSNPVGGTSGTIGGGTLNLNETFTNNSTHNIDNALWMTGPSSGISSSLSQTMRKNDAVTGLPVNQFNVVGTSGTGTARISTSFNSAGFAVTAATADLNASGTTAFVGAMYSGTAASFQDPIISNAPNGGGATTGSGSRFIGYKPAGGSLSILAFNGMSAPQSHPFGTGTSANEVFTASTTDTTLTRLNRNGQAAYTVAFSTAVSGTTASNNDTAWIYTPGSGSTMVYREGDAYNPSSNVGTLTSGLALGSTRSFSNAGLLYSSALVNPATAGTPGGTLGDGQAGDGDVSTTAGVANNSALYLSTPTGTTRLFRQNDPAPGMGGAGPRLGSLSATTAVASLDINNSGSITFACGLQGSGTVAAGTGQLGNNIALFAGIPGSTLGPIARLGDAAPGFAGGTLNLAANVVPLMDNNGTVLFTSPVVSGIASDGTYTGTLTTVASSALFGWSPGETASTLLLYVGQTVTVDTGVTKTISAFSVSAAGNGDGGVQGMSDAFSTFTARLTFSDATWAVVKLQAPAPGTGALALLGLGAMARRRRR